MYVCNGTWKLVDNLQVGSHLLPHCYHIHPKIKLRLLGLLAVLLELQCRNKPPARFDLQAAVTPGTNHILQTRLLAVLSTLCFPPLQL